MKITKRQLRRIIREQLETETKVDPVDQKLYDTFLSSGVMALSLAESGLGSPELVNNMRIVVDHIRRMRDSWDPKDKERKMQDPDFDEWMDNRAVALGAEKYVDESQKSPGRIALSKIGKIMGEPLLWRSLAFTRSGGTLQDLAYTLATAERGWLYPYTMSYAKYREQKLKEMFEWAGVP
jgi:hypothetical protein